ncbi:response regulator, partial [Vibrio harveyi]
VYLAAIPRDTPR